MVSWGVGSRASTSLLTLLEGEERERERHIYRERGRERERERVVKVELIREKRMEWTDDCLSSLSKVRERRSELYLGWTFIE